MSNTSSQSMPAVERERQASQAQRTAEAKDAFIGSLKAASTHIDSDLQERAKDIHANEKALTNQQKDLQKQTKDLAKQTDALEKFVAKSQKQMAQFDNFEPLSAELDQQLAELEELLDIVEQGDPTQTQRPDNRHDPL